MCVCVGVRGCVCVCVWVGVGVRTYEGCTLGMEGGMEGK